MVVKQIFLETSPQNLNQFSLTREGLALFRSIRLMEVSDQYNKRRNLTLEVAHPGINPHNYLLTSRSKRKQIQ